MFAAHFDVTFLGSPKYVLTKLQSLNAADLQLCEKFSSKTAFLVLSCTLMKKADSFPWRSCVIGIVIVALSLLVIKFPFPEAPFMISFP
jgi:hypothetical protein